MPSLARLASSVGLSVVALSAGITAACSASSGGATGAGGDTSSASGPAGPGAGTGGGFTTGSSSSGGDPGTCDEAAASHTYIGCDYWPTVTANNVWSIFDYTVVVANAGAQPADVTVTRGGAEIAHVTVQPDQLEKLYLPWVPELKGGDFNPCTDPVLFEQTVRSAGGAYHLVSTSPVTVYQFSALEYAGQAGAPDKDWASCPGNQYCAAFGEPAGCFSFSNDASLLLPTTAMTGNYRITGPAGEADGSGAYVAVTGTQDGTNVTFTLSSTATLAAGGGMSATGPGGKVSFTLDAGDVVELVGTPSSDLSGSLVKADKPVQVVSGQPCLYMPASDLNGTCDHVEESVFPAETLGKHYFVTVPTGPHGTPVGHVVRIFGNVDGTALTYPAGAPAGAPASIQAGEAVDLGTVSQDFEIEGDHELAVATVMLTADIVDPSPAGEPKGDPSVSQATAVEQYRTKYVFLAPTDYDTSYVDVVQPMDATVTIDGQPVGAQPVAIGSGFGVARVELGQGSGGAHVLVATAPVGIQVMGYGSYTSYQYPGGSNLTAIAPAPPK